MDKLNFEPHSSSSDSGNTFYIPCKGSEYSFTSWPVGVGKYIAGDCQQLIGGGSRWGFQYRVDIITIEIKENAIEEGDFNNMDILALLAYDSSLETPGMSFTPQGNENGDETEDEKNGQEGGGDYDKYGVSLYLGPGFGYKTFFGSGFIRLGNLKSTISYNAVDGSIKSDTEFMIFSGGGSLPLLNLGGNVEYGYESGFKGNATFLGWEFSTKQELLINNTAGKHSGFIGFDLFQKTDNIYEYIRAFPDARQNHYDTWGYPIPRR